MIDAGIADDYEFGTGEINNIVYLCCKYTVGWQMRQSDLAVCQSMAGEMRGNAGLERLLQVTCEYLWDHISGEPDEFTAEQLQSHMAPVIETWFKSTTKEQREDIQ